MGGFEQAEQLRFLDDFAGEGAGDQRSRNIGSIGYSDSR